jgi:hypothetical protein
VHSNCLDQGRQRLFGLPSGLLGYIPNLVPRQAGFSHPLTMLSFLLLSVYLLHVTHISVATYLDLTHRSPSLPDILARAANGTSGLDIGGGGYNINITLGGKTFLVLIDTGRWAFGFVCSLPFAHCDYLLAALKNN